MGQGKRGRRNPRASNSPTISALCPLFPCLPSQRSRLQYEEGGSLSELHELAGELERQDTPEGVRVRARVPEAAAPRFERFVRNGAGPASRPP